MGSYRRLSRRNKGFAAVEMTMVAPIFLLLIVAAFDLTQAIQANHIIISISREGGNIVSRSSTETPQEIMDIISVTSGNLDLSEDGAIYITELIGQEDESPYVNSQYKWNQSGLDKDSVIWPSCSSWDAEGACNDIDENDPPEVDDLSIELEAGESVYTVEIFYDYSPIFNLILGESHLLSDVTYM
ncbi:pilus assembly protein [Vibrio sp. T187]|uniref:TadE/TadG family type IV pilus assembly protein n=1 Tax=Vibrio TaxID=662 RepID=UPI0010C9BF2E|nr:MULTISPECIES: TadE family protein [Vibrio]MBW3694237.1 pilus assembly protein [Vibrio sp. T187]